MFDFGFSEMIMILVVALLVVGPERLPGLARTAGFWVGKAKRFVADVKSEIDLELAAEQLKKTLDKQNALQDVFEIIEETKQVGKELKQDYEQDETSALDKAQAEPEPEESTLPNKKSS